VFIAQLFEYIHPPIKDLLPGIYIASGIFLLNKEQEACFFDVGDHEIGCDFLISQGPFLVILGCEDKARAV